VVVSAPAALNQDQAPDNRLATYGSLAPGRVNHNQVASLRGNWSTGTVRGNLHDAGWGSALGFPGLQLDPAGTPIDVHLFESDDLPQHWARLDEFEGPGYRRAVARVSTASGDVDAWIYVLAR
jgi:gamma-glutamylcyclotransferase (GGCT)/AIG2-like uncharacterized protein YtfP